MLTLLDDSSLPLIAKNSTLNESNDKPSVNITINKNKCDNEKTIEAINIAPNNNLQPIDLCNKINYH